MCVLAPPTLNSQLKALDGEVDLPEVVVRVTFHSSGVCGKQLDLAKLGSSNETQNPVYQTLGPYGPLPDPFHLFSSGFLGASCYPEVNRCFFNPAVVF